MMILLYFYYIIIIINIGVLVVVVEKQKVKLQGTKSLKSLIKERPVEGRGLLAWKLGNWDGDRYLSQNGIRVSKMILCTYTINNIWVLFFL